ncbi:GNAT family N-acetyltransferase [Streptomyces pratensis]|uniref:GNAT family N-acetyltransferase n=1 Tax=Streptomyces pratensis TaxID=1169025 RepID=UPI0019323707|nr:GNAT family protein [Streptomyces pratensis]
MGKLTDVRRSGGPRGGPGRQRSVISPALFSFSLGKDAALLPLTPAITEPFHGLQVRNHERIGRWEPVPAVPPTLAETRNLLEVYGRSWLGGASVDTAIAVVLDDEWELAGAANLRVDHQQRAAEFGCWLDPFFEGRGLARRSFVALVDHAFNGLRLDRVTTRATADNERSRAMIEKLGFVQEGVHRKAVYFADGRRDEISYAILSQEWAGGAGVSADGLSVLGAEKYP